MANYDEHVKAAINRVKQGRTQDQNDFLKNAIFTYNVAIFCQKSPVFQAAVQDNESVQKIQILLTIALEAGRLIGYQEVLYSLGCKHSA